MVVLEELQEQILERMANEFWTLYQKSGQKYKGSWATVKGKAMLVHDDYTNKDKLEVTNFNPFVDPELKENFRKTYDELIAGVRKSIADGKVPGD